MKTFFLIRHAKSSWDFPELSDFDRPLNKRGNRDAPFMGKQLYASNIKPELIVSSPANRAKTTATIIAGELDYPKESILLKEELYHAPINTIMTVIRGISDEHNTIFVFGHNPGFTDFANEFNTEAYIPNVPTCGIVTVESSATSWKDIDENNSKLVAFIYPKMF